MNELIEQVTQKVGISPDQARTAVETVLNFLKERLPEPLAGQVESALSGSGPAGLGAVAEKIGNLLGKQG